MPPGTRREDAKRFGPPIPSKRRVEARALFSIGRTPGEGPACTRPVEPQLLALDYGEQLWVICRLPHLSEEPAHEYAEHGVPK